MELSDYRQEIDRIDGQLVELFQERMNLASEIAQHKAAKHLPVHDPARERDKLKAVGELVKPELRNYTQRLYTMLFELSRSKQSEEMQHSSELQQRIAKAISDTPPMFPTHGRVAVQGIEGANSQGAAEKLFATPDLMFFNSFEGVFSAIDKGLCQYGVLPLENSTAGSVNRIYDLMMAYDFSIVRSTRLKIDHNLLANVGVKISDIKEIISHEQALAQCEGFIKSLGNVKITSCENTAMAAKLVFESGRKDIAALSSRSCADLYSLNLLQTSVQDSGSNFTRFICISKKLEIYPGADRSSIMMALPHKPGSLYHALGRFYALGINLNKLESRPLAGSDFEFMFYFDLETSVYSDEFMQLFSDIEGLGAQFKYLGSYLEIS